MIYKSVSSFIKSWKQGLIKLSYLLLMGAMQKNGVWKSADSE